MQRLVAMIVAASIGLFTLAACSSESSPEVLDLLKKSSKKQKNNR